MDVAERPPPMRWTTERYLALVDSGVIPEGRGVELVDGQVVTQMPQGKIHFLICLALQKAFAAMDATNFGLAVQPTILLENDNAFDPEFAFLSADYKADDLPRSADVLWVIEVSDSSRTYDLGRKRDVYAAAGIPHYWVVDVVKRGIWDFSKPTDGFYKLTRFVAEGESIETPLIGKALDVTSLYPASEQSV